MKLLALETCLAACSAAVTRPANGNGSPDIVARRELRERGHAEAIMPMIVRAMEQADCRFEDLERIAVTVGPGSFSGVRVGVAAARGLSLATGAPLVGLTTLAVMERRARRESGVAADNPISIAHDARRGQVYFGRFDGHGAALDEIALLTPELAAARMGEGEIAAGSGAYLLVAARPDLGISAQLPDLLPDAEDLAQMALTAQPAEETVSPLYLRPPDAKPQTGKSVPRRG
jgi:tRNA threonylcarbamoyl adenosine modification protein YeaZ